MTEQNSVTEILFLSGNLQPGLNGNPFLWLEKLRQKDWEWKTEKLPK